MASFIHLDVRAPYSEERTSIVKIAEAFRYAKEQEMPTVGITESGSSYCAIDTIRLAEKFGVQPVFSVALRAETEEEDEYGVLLFPTKAEGLFELWQCVNIVNRGETLEPSDVEGFQNLAVVLDVENVFGCKDGEKAAYKVYEAWAAKKPYVALKGTSSPLVEKNNQAVRTWGVPSVVLTDVLYVKAEHKEAQEMWRDIVSRREKKKNKNKNKNKVHKQHLKTAEELLEEGFTEQELLQNQRFVETLGLVMPPKQEPRYASVPVPKGLRVPMNLWSMFDAPEGFVPPEDPERVREIAHLVAEAYDGLLRNYEGTSLLEDAYARMRYELGVVIAEKGKASGYFLVVQNLCNYMRKQNIPVGPGRGSAVGSILVHCLGITEICPLQYGLYFDRFKNLYRTDVTDVDVDISALRNHEVYQYVEETYGKKRVAKTMVHNSYGWNPALRDIGNRLEIKPYIIRKLENKKYQKIYDKDTGELSPLVQEAVQNHPELERLVEMALLLVGLPRSTSFHPSAVIISDSDLEERLPVLYKKDEECGWIYGIQLNDDAKQLEWLGEIKYDMLNSIACDILAALEEKTEIQVQDIPLNDELTNALFQKGESTATYQMDSQSMRRTLEGLSPRNLLEIALVISLNRPGAFQYIDYCIRRKRNGDKMEAERRYLASHPALKEVLQTTNGLLTMEKQVIEILCIWTGCDPKHAERWMYEGGIEELLEEEMVGDEFEEEDELDSDDEETKAEKVEHARKWFYEQSELAGWSSEETKRVYYSLHYFSRYDVIREHPDVQPLLQETYGVPVYQEQIMALLKAWAGYTLAEADTVRRIMSKKKVEGMAREKERFLRKSAESGRKRELSEILFSMVSRFARYGFNKSHAIAYALQGYRMGYFKARAPQLFLSETLNLIGKEKKDKMPLYLEEMYKYGLQEPDIRTSGEFFVPDGDKIHFGLKAIKGLSEAQIRTIEIEREKQPFYSFKEIHKRLNGVLSPDAFRALIKAGALDAFGERMDLLKQLESGEMEDGLQLYGLPGFKSDAVKVDLPIMAKRVMEQEGMYYSKIVDPMERYRDVLMYISSLHPKKELVRVVRTWEHTIPISGDKMGFLTTRGKGWKSITVFSKEWGRYNFREWDVALVSLKESSQAKRENGFVLGYCQFIRSAVVLAVTEKDFASCEEYRNQQGVWHLLYCEGTWKAVSAERYEEMRLSSLAEMKIRFV